MENLRLLILQNAAKFPTNIFKYLPNIKWIEYSSSNVQWYFPISFVVNGGLVGLVINGVSNKHPGIIFEDCKMLKHVDLSYWRLLEETPDFSVALNLEKLYLRSCKRLEMIHGSIASLSKLVTLDLEGCENLEKLPSSFLMLKSLEVLNLSGCIKLKEIPDLSASSSLKELHLRECYNLRIIHDSVGRFLDKLVILDFEGCRNLERLPRYISKSGSIEVLNLDSCRKIEQIFDNYFEKFPSHLKYESLKVLNLSYCQNLKGITDFSFASNLEILDLRGCFSLRTIHESVGSLDKLIALKLDSCHLLEELPSCLRLKSLDSLSLTNCYKLEQLPEFDENMKSLREMNLKDFLENLSNFCTTLKELNLSGNKFCSLPSLQNFSSLRHLELRNCKFLRNIVKIPHCLTRVDASGCELFVISPDYIADIMFRNQDLELRNFKRELIVAYSKIPKFCNNQTTESSTSFSFQQNSDTIIPALVVCVVFKVDEDSCDAEGFIRFQVLIDGYDAYYGRLVWVKIRAYVVTKNSSITIDILERE
uniref:Melon resistance-like protein n=1 Tax=Cucumis melo subsp. melo TaxID=412675 RepID=E5GBC2_CUCME|nr:melon resistance-like protein [Cucumis melo subsp. melo]